MTVTIHCIIKDLTCGLKPFQGSANDFNGRILIDGYEQLKKGKEHFTMISNYITSKKAPSPLDDMESHGKGI